MKHLLVALVCLAWVPALAADANRGETLYSNVACGRCHTNGPQKGTVGSKMPNLAVYVDKHNPDDLYKWIIGPKKEKANGHGCWTGHLTENQVYDLYAYLQGTAHPLPERSVRLKQNLQKEQAKRTTGGTKNGGSR